MSETKLTAETRTEFGKGAARRIRREHKVPAVLYGHGTDPVHITLPGHDTMLALKHGGTNALLAIDVDGKETLVLPKQVQRHPVKGELEHLDLLIVRRGEKVVVEVPVHVVGEAASETLVTVDHATLSVEAEATHIPDFFEVSVEGAEAGTQILAKDVELPSGSALMTDAEALVVNVSAAPTAEEVEAELADAEAEAGIEHEASDKELEAEAAAEGESSTDSGDAAEGSTEE
ncbi:50S ribosomal protein L25/general stress protein Ctc [Nocardioides marmoribigeumensis]|uniref:Large ribosomal subunit protein bL25 n=1 Tax=Nocardioides marmoribigeumensis TaxID=433649 RepID=A0ABU2BZG9_9ACTN|nr:50S ribosomal protein L25/general stress protein Ctc [Nocardioides marmoribigeumensis]MDR7363797.1 large subunit ribosomal protein L25 [Nocardioides marmoribigeumensis]